MELCSFEGCDKPIKVKRDQLCSGHHSQKLRGQPLKPLEDRSHRGRDKLCTFDGCGLKSKSYGLCSAHAWQRRQGRELTPRWRGGLSKKTKEPLVITTFVNGSGYVTAIVYPKHPGYTYANPERNRECGRYISEHRLVMSLHLGRKLKTWETVHHIDGIRSNNTVGNLQLRHGSHGEGQKIICADCGSHNTVAVELD